MSKKPVRFYVDIDRTRWTMDGTAEDQFVTLSWDGDDAFFRFIADIAEGNIAYLKNADGRQLGRFSLGGSYASLQKLVECAERIAGSSSDPFATSSDPFSGSDPF